MTGGKIRARLPKLFQASILAAICGALVWPAMATETNPPKTTRQDQSARADKTDNNVLRTTLKNGLRVVVVRNTLAPVATMEMNYLVGANDTPKNFPGTAHALEHMMFRGSPGLSSNQLAAISAALGGNFNANTQQTITQYYFTVPAEDLNLALHIGALRMRGLDANPKLWKQERGAIEQEVAADHSNPQYLFYTRLLKAMFAGTAYAKDGLGTRPSFNKTTAKNLKHFYQKWYTPNNAILVIVGDVEPKATLASVKRLFGSIPRAKTPAHPKVKLNPVKAKTLHLSTDLPYGLALVSFRLPGYKSSDYAAAQVLSAALASKRGALYSLVPQGKALYAGFQNNALPAAGLGFAIGVFPRGADAKALIKAIRQKVRGIVKHGISADLVAAAKRQALTSMKAQTGSIEGLANIWSQTLAVEGHASPQVAFKNFEQVSVADVNRVAKRYLDQAHAITAILTPQPSGKPATSKGFGGAESFTPKQTKPVKLPQWAREPLKRLHVPESVVRPVTSTLANGLRLIVQPEATSKVVEVYGHIKNNPDMEIAKGQEGVSSVLDAMFDYGTKNLNRLQYQQASDEIGASIQAGTDFSLQVLPNHLGRGMQLLAGIERHPALPKKAFQIVQAQTARSVAGQLHSPGFLTELALDKALYPKNDPGLRHATPKSVQSLTLKDVRNYHTKVYRPDLTTVVIIGKIKPQRAEAVVEKYFGAWQASGKAPATDYPQVPANKPSSTVVPNKSRVQDRVTLAQTLALKRSNPDYYALDLGNHVLGGGFYATRLYRVLREQNGLVYHVDSSFDIGKTRSTYTLGYASDPPKVAKARRLAVHELVRMQKHPVSASELHQAKAFALRQIPLNEASTTRIAQGLLQRSSEDLPLDEPSRAAHRYIKLDAKDIRKAFAKWLQPKRLVQIVEGPKPK